VPTPDHPRKAAGVPADRRPLWSRARHFFFALASTFALAAALPAAAQDLPPQAAAVIKGEIVGEAEFAAYLKSYLRSKLYHGGSAARVAELANAAMDNLIADRLLLAEAERRGIAADPDIITARLQAIEQRYRDRPDWPQIEALLPKIRAEIEAQVRIEALKTAVEQVTPPSEQAVLDYYHANPDLFTQPPAFDLDVILIRVLPSATKDEWNAAQQKAEALHAAILAGENFDALAREHATGTLAEGGGKLGRVHAGQLVPSAEELVAATSVGGITAPIRLLDGVAIFRVNDKIAATVSPFEAVRDRAEILYRRDRARDQWSTLIADLRTSATVTVADIASLVPRLMQSVEAQ